MSISTVILLLMRRSPSCSPRWVPPLDGMPGSNCSVPILPSCCLMKLPCFSAAPQHPPLLRSCLRFLVGPITFPSVVLGLHPHLLRVNPNWIREMFLPGLPLLGTLSTSRLFPSTLPPPFLRGSIRSSSPVSNPLPSWT